MFYIRKNEVLTIELLLNYRLNDQSHVDLVGLFLELILPNTSTYLEPALNYLRFHMKIHPLIIYEIDKIQAQLLIAAQIYYTGV